MRYEFSDLEGNSWNNLISQFSNPHIFQTWEWGEVKSQVGWRAYPIVWKDESNKEIAAALVLKRDLYHAKINYGFSILYVPKGPVLSNWYDHEIRGKVLRDLFDITKKLNAIFIKIDPDIQLGHGFVGQSDYTISPGGYEIANDIKNSGWIFSENQIQYKNTIIIDLSLSEDELLANMKQKTRYNIRLATKRGVKVRRGGLTEVDLLFDMYFETSIRDGFLIREREYYLSAWSKLMHAGMAEAFLAEVNGEVVAGLILFFFGSQAWYLYGMSRSVQRDKMPNYLLQWAAMKKAKEHGCLVYDLWGAPNDYSNQDPLWGVYKFKEGLGGKVVRHIGAWDLINSPVRYKLYQVILPKILRIMRSRYRVSSLE